MAGSKFLIAAIRVITLLVYLGSQRIAVAQSADETLFESKIRPVLIEHCHECHSRSTTMESGLGLDSRQAILQGGDRGPLIATGDPAASLLFRVLSHSDPDLKMPPDAERLPPDVINDFRRWIESGAAYPSDSDLDRAHPGESHSGSKDTEGLDSGKPLGRSQIWQARLEHWAYRPILDPAVPAVQHADWPVNELDYFVLSRLEESQLEPSPDADSAVLLRRLYFDLIGLPPTLDDVERFQERVVEEGLQASIDETVDALLAREQYGERWGRHWLDVARFAESSGNEANIAFPYAWRFRDYVLDCFNDDLGFDRFILEQLAGDLLPYQSEQERARLLIATGFLALGPKNLDEANEKQFAADLVDEQINAMSRAFLASSIACARCHDHKTDPFSMEDYYALAGIFQSTKTYFGTAVSPANRVGGDPMRLPEKAELPILHASIGKKKTDELKSKLASLQSEEKTLRQEGRLTLRDALRIIWQSGGIEGNLEKVDDHGNALPLAMGVQEREQISDAPLLIRGEVNNPGKQIPRGVPTMGSELPKFGMPTHQSGRLETAHWLTSAKHPLTSRVWVNRVWHHLMGAGMVSSVDDFGTTGSEASHPQLLDFLSTRFIREGWSTKELIREIVCSRTYRQSSTFRQVAFEADPQNRWLWRASKRRLEAEAIRDAMLSVSGELDLQRPQGSLVGQVIGDGPISLIGLNKKLPTDLDGAAYRSVYLPVIRDRLPDVLDVFDFAEPSLVTGSRENTNVPTQSLYMLNSHFVRERSQEFAARLQAACPDRTTMIGLAFQSCYSRSPSERELEASQQFLENADSERLAEFCQALFCAAEFRVLD